MNAVGIVKDVFHSNYSISNCFAELVSLFVPTYYEVCYGYRLINIFMSYVFQKKFLQCCKR